MSPIEVKGACPHNCPDTCGWIVTVDEESGAPLKIAGDPDHPYTQGWLCTKVNRYLEFVLHAERLRHPLRRVGAKGEGKWARISWDEALDEITARWQEIIATAGSEAILPYSYSGTLGGVQSYVANERFWTRLRASRLERTICSAAGTAALRYTVGGSFGSDPEDIPNTRLLVLWGSNPASTHPHMVPRIDAARRNGARVVVIDPHRTLTANRADNWLAVRPGADAALALAMMHVLFAEGLVDREWAEEHTVGLDALERRAREHPPEWAAPITGLSAREIRELAQLYGETRPAMIRISMGLQRHSNGGNTVRAIACLPALVGSYGTSGGGLLYSTGGYWDWPQDVLCPDELGPRDTRLINMNQLGEALLSADPPIRSLYVFNSNPAAVAPAGAKVQRGLRREDLFTVVHDLFLTDTADLADIVLPATSQFEHWDLHKAYGHTYIALNRPAMAPLGEAKSNHDVFRLLAERMGFIEPSLHQTSDEVIPELLARGGPAVKGITFESLLETGHARLNLPLAPMVPFHDGFFPTPSGKVELYNEQLAQSGQDPLPGWVPDIESAEAAPDAARRYPLQLVSPASHHFLNSSFGNLPTLLRHAKEPEIELCPADASARGLADGDWVEVANDRGAFGARLRVRDTVRPGVAATATVWWRKLSPDGRNANDGTNDALTDYARGATFHGNLVEVRPA